MQKLNHFMRRRSNWWLYGAGAVPALWMFYQGLTGALGADPIDKLLDFYGITALQLFIATLAVSPLKRLVGIDLAKQRRPLGLLTFFYALCHVMVWAILDQGIDLAQIWQEILKRPFITLGMIAFTLMIPLALTSNNKSLRKLGPIRWRKLHIITFPIGIIAAIHFILIVKGWQVEPFLYFGGIAFLILLRIIWKFKKALMKS